MTMSDSVEKRSKEDKEGNLHGSGSCSEGEFSVEEAEYSLEVNIFLRISAMVVLYWMLINFYE
jgi:hypothetical protein